jgi:hypothetical protein
MKANVKGELRHFISWGGGVGKQLYCIKNSQALAARPFDSSNIEKNTSGWSQTATLIKGGGIIIIIIIICCFNY